MSLGLVSYDDSDESENEDVSETPVGEETMAVCGTSYDKKINSLPGTSFDKKETSDQNNISQLNHIRSLRERENKQKSEVIHSSQLDYNKIKVERVNEPQNSPKIYLPPSKISSLNTDIDIKCLTSTNKKNVPVKITIPSLNEIEEESEPPAKKKLKPSQKGSGLFALLPNPKNSIIPQPVLRKNQSITKAATNSSKITSLKKAPKASNINKTSLISYEDSEDEDETSGTIDFFSLENKDEDIIPAPIEIDTLQEVNCTVQNMPSRERYIDSLPPSEAPSSTASTSSSPSSNLFVHQQPDHVATSQFMSVSNEDLQLDQDAMQQLCGRRDRLKMQEVNIIDVSGDAIMPDPREWLTKQLTEEQNHITSHKKKDGPTTQQKRKHQITYLAFQAKENELELKNQWSNNRMSRKQTQAKYGF